MFNEIVIGLNSDEIRASSYFSRHQDQQIASFVADIISEKYELSENWKKKDIFVLGKDERLVQATEQTVLRFKEKRISTNIDKIAKSLASIEDNIERQKNMKELMKLNELRNLINFKLNRVL